MQDFTNYLETFLQNEPKQHMEHMHSNDINNDCIDRMPLAMAYVPMQTFDQTYETMCALQNGTLFPELNKPFSGKFVNWR